MRGRKNNWRGSSEIKKNKKIISKISDGERNRRLKKLKILRMRGDEKENEIEMFSFILLFFIRLSLTPFSHHLYSSIFSLFFVYLSYFPSTLLLNSPNTFSISPFFLSYLRRRGRNGRGEEKNGRYPVRTGWRAIRGRWESGRTRR